MRTTVTAIGAAMLFAIVSVFPTTAQAPSSQASPAAPGQTQTGAGAPEQTIRLEPADGRVRLRLEGRETWTIEARSFDVTPNDQGIRLVAQPVGISIRAGKIDHVANEFELTVTRAGTLGFQIRESRRPVR